MLLYHLCYASGNTEPGLSQGTFAEARERVDNYGAGFIGAGARAVHGRGPPGPPGDQHDAPAVHDQPDAGPGVPQRADVARAPPGAVRLAAHAGPPLPAGRGHGRAVGLLSLARGGPRPAGLGRDRRARRRRPTAGRPTSCSPAPPRWSRRTASGCSARWPRRRTPPRPRPRPSPGPRACGSPPRRRPPPTARACSRRPISGRPRPATSARRASRPATPHRPSPGRWTEARRPAVPQRRRHARPAGRRGPVLRAHRGDADGQERRRDGRLVGHAGRRHRPLRLGPEERRRRGGQGRRLHLDPEGTRRLGQRGDHGERRVHRRRHAADLEGDRVVDRGPRRLDGVAGRAQHHRQGRAVRRALDQLPHRRRRREDLRRRRQGERRTARPRSSTARRTRPGSASRGASSRSGSTPAHRASAWR